MAQTIQKLNIKKSENPYLFLIYLFLIFSTAIYLNSCTADNLNKIYLTISIDDDTNMVINLPDTIKVEKFNLGDKFDERIYFRKNADTSLLHIIYEYGTQHNIDPELYDDLEFNLIRRIYSMFGNVTCEKSRIRKSKDNISILIRFEEVNAGLIYCYKGKVIILWFLNFVNPDEINQIYNSIHFEEEN